MSYEAGSSLRDVVSSTPDVLRLWHSNKVTYTNHVFVALFEKYWGKSIEDEEAQWRKSAGTMDVDDSNFVLDFSIEGIHPSKDLVRLDFIRIYDELEKWLIRKAMGSIAPSALPTGQPGIGKSVWIKYAALVNASLLSGITARNAICL